MFGKHRRLSITNEQPSCRTCLFSAYNDEYDLVCKGKKTVEPDKSCRKYKLDITKAANERKHIIMNKKFDENSFKL